MPHSRTLLGGLTAGFLFLSSGEVCSLRFALFDLLILIAEIMRDLVPHRLFHHAAYCVFIISGFFKHGEFEDGDLVGKHHATVALAALDKRYALIKTEQGVAFGDVILAELRFRWLVRNHHGDVFQFHQKPLGNSIDALRDQLFKSLVRHHIAPLLLPYPEKHSDIVYDNIEKNDVADSSRNDAHGHNIDHFIATAHRIVERTNTFLSAKIIDKRDDKRHEAQRAKRPLIISVKR